jgi:predicted amidohydrolase YtcJ
MYSLTAILVTAIGLAVQTKPLVLRHVTLIDMTAVPVKSDMALVIVGDRIQAVGKTAELSVPRNAEVLDLHGKFLIPGLWDMHTHIDKPAYISMMLANGVTGVRAMGSTVDQSGAWREAIAATGFEAPRTFRLGISLMGPTGQVT